ncbi:MAG: hypothetical protein DWQ01_11930 [Planctomycetota bacterium]|nr:MAG: hypothetical protein DWQ01_11930 [Planctomycetota bacterium]
MLHIYYHRDFDGMCAAALLAAALEECDLEQELTWSGVNFDRTLNWDTFGIGKRFALVDFHFHPRADYWFDHHPTTFLNENFEKQYRANSRQRFDPEAQSCPPIILKHAEEEWNWKPSDRDRFLELCQWSDIIDSASFHSAKQALFGTEPALRIARALTCAPDFHFHDRVVYLLRHQSLLEVSCDEEIDRCFRRAEGNRDKALEAFPRTMLERTEFAMLADLRSKRIRRERFAPFYLYPELHYVVTLIPTRAGVHITAASNPWNRPAQGPHLGELMKRYGGGGHQGVGGVNPPDNPTAEAWAREIFEAIRSTS